MCDRPSHRTIYIGDQFGLISLSLLMYYFTFMQAILIILYSRISYNTHQLQLRVQHVQQQKTDISFVKKGQNNILLLYNFPIE
jgi:uncharacterized membrane protein YfhO